MFKSVFLFELKSWLRNPVFYIYLLFFGGLAFLAFIGTAGFFDPEPKDATADYLNSPYGINYMLQFFNKLFLFLLPTIVGATIYKDFKAHRHSLLYSFPLHKHSYFLGKFLSAFLVVVIIVFFTYTSLMLAEQVPHLHNTKIGAFNAMGYLQSLCLYTIPNLLFSGLIVFSVVAYSRNIYAGFMVVILMFFVQNISENIFNGHGFLIALFDPLAQNTADFITQNWTLEDKNFQLIPVEQAIVYNRIVWLTIGSALMGYVYKTFHFSEHPNFNFRVKRKFSKVAAKSHGRLPDLNSLSITYNFTLKNQFKQIWKLSHFDFRSIAKSWMFYVFIFFGIVAVIFSIGRVTNKEEMIILPVTHIVLTIPAFFFTNIIMLLTFMYSGLLVHKSKTSNMDQLIDTTATTHWVFLLSKVLAIVKMQLVLLLIMLIAGLTIQLYNGYYHFELGLYLFDLFVLKFLGLLIWALLSITIHTFVRNTYLGIFALILIWLGGAALPQVGIDTRLLLFNFTEPIPYSDLNGYGHRLLPYLLVKSYWLLAGLLLLISTYLFWNRGFLFSIKERWSKAMQRWDKRVLLVSTVLFSGFFLMGFAIYKGEQKLELATTSQNALFENFEKTFDKYSSIELQPKITSVTLNIDLFPEESRFAIHGDYVLTNKTGNSIDTLLLKNGFDETTTFTFDRDYRIIDKDDYVHFYVIAIDPPLAPSDSLHLNFDMSSKPATLFENDSKVLGNGTFIKNNIFPRIGYFLNRASKHPTDTTARRQNYYTQGADLVDLKTIISTSKDQIAVAPGTLVKQWKENDRNYYEYQSDSKIKNSYSFNSGDFEVVEEAYKNTIFKIYSHKNHTYNVDNKLRGLKASYDYNTQYFGDYLHQETRVIEFPMTEGSFASVMANSIPTSEMRFISNSTEEKVDLAFYTQAHELTHHWFGGRLIPADALGAVLLTESITEYISLHIYAKEFGKDKALEFLKLQRERYLRGRTQAQEEPPLYLVKGEEQYLSYGKGTIAFNTLGHYLGKEEMHRILRTFLEEYSDSYPTSTDLLKFLKQHVPGPLLSIVEDYFETVTLHEASLNSVTFNSNEVGLDFDYSKFRNNKVFTDIELNDPIEIGFYDDDGKLMALETVRVKSGNNAVTIPLDQRPTKVILDPHALLIENDIMNNTYDLRN
ncbi:MAG: hypothetical protein KTR22_13840 [Flavobacteriaceae bacterium]|nr:hypothetical protein [Flavobacteriaceae bacterium]